MRRLLHTVVSLAWGLWFGGLVMLFASVQALFNTFAERRELAGEGAAGIFRVFNYYHLALAAGALALTFVWWIAGRSHRKTTVFTLFALATVAAVYVSSMLNPQMERLRLDGLTHTTHFRQLHGLAMGVYLGETIFVLLAGIALPWAARSPSDARRVIPPALQI